MRINSDGNILSKLARARTASGASVVLVLAAILLLTTCDLFKPGLGAKVDITAPTLSITAPSQNAYVKGTMTLTGTAGDDRAVSTLTVRYDGVGGPVSRDVTVSHGAWSLSVPTGAGAADNLPDGQQQFNVTATDGSGKSTDTSLIVFVDNAPPTVIVTVPQGYAGSKPTLSGIFDVKGEVWVASPVQNVTVRIYDGGTLVATKLADGTNTWSARFDISNDPPFTNLGTFEYAVDVTDKAGNQNTYYYDARDIGILRDTFAAGSPFPATDEIGKLDQAGTGSLSGFTFAQLHATRLGPERSVYGDFTRDIDGTKPVVHLSNLDPLQPFTSNVLSTQVPINGYANPGPSDNTGIVTTVHAWIADFSAPVWDATTAVAPGDVYANPIGSSINFRVEPRRGGSLQYLPSGHYIARIQASTDSGADSPFMLCVFMVDAGAPTMGTPVPVNLSLITRKTFTSPPLTGQTGVEMLVSAVDDNPGLTFSAQASLVDSPWAALPGISWTDTGAGLYRVQVPLGSGHSDIWFSATATDSTGTTALLSPVHYQIDETAPTVAIVAPTQGSFVTGNSTTVSGTATDNSGQLKNIFVWLGLAAASPPADPTTWTSLSGNASWATTLPLGAEGAYTVKAVSMDFAGNLSAVASKNFSLDQANPTLTETSIGSAPRYINTLFTLSGVMADTNAIAHLVITQKKNGGAPTTVLDDATITGTSSPWTWSVPGGETDGTFEYTITLTDAAGKTAPVMSRTVIYDRVQPSITVTSLSPVLGTNTVNGVVTLQAAVSDGSALDKVWYRYGGLVGDPTGYTEITVNKTTPVLVIDTTVAATFPDLASTNVWLKASDLAGNVQIASATLAVDQSSDNPALILTNLDASRTNPLQASGNLLNPTPR